MLIDVDEMPRRLLVRRSGRAAAEPVREKSYGIVVLVVGGAAQPVAVHASQQLVKAPSPTHELPPPGSVQCSLSRFVLHFVLPDALVRQQATNPGLPQVERA